MNNNVPRHISFKTERGNKNYPNFLPAEANTEMKTKLPNISYQLRNNVSISRFSSDIIKLFPFVKCQAPKSTQDKCTWEACFAFDASGCAPRDTCHKMTSQFAHALHNVQEKPNLTLSKWFRQVFWLKSSINDSARNRKSVSVITKTKYEIRWENISFPWLQAVVSVSKLFVY